jgi:hypothetical protein
MSLSSKLMITNRFGQFDLRKRHHRYMQIVAINVHSASWLGFILFAALLIGCRQSGPEVAPVTGRVQLDGRPLKNADVVFQPIGPGSPSYGRTDADGRYELGYKRGVPGALLGEHNVSISVSSEIVAKPPRIAPQERRVKVESGDNGFNFDETSAK